MRTPAYKLTIGGKVVDTTDEPKASTVVDLAVTLDMDTPADSVTLVLGNADGLKPERDDEATVELGYADNGDLVQVMAGTVVTVEPNLTTTRLVGHSAAAMLLRTFVEQTYESKTAGDVVRDLAGLSATAQAGLAGVDVATAEAGITFPAYVVDGRRSVYQHMRDLAELSGFDLYINAGGELVFKKFISGETVHVLEYAKHIVELDVLRTPPRADLVEARVSCPYAST